MKHKFLLSVIFLSLWIPAAAQAKSSTVEHLLDYEPDTQEVVVDYSDKSIEVNSGASSLQEELHLSNQASTKAIKHALEEAGYLERSRNGQEVTYRSRFENKRLIVKGSPASSNIDQAFFAGWTIFQYDSIEDTADAYAAFQESGYPVFPDEPLQLSANMLNGRTSILNRGGSRMQLDDLQSIGTNDVTVAVLDTGFNPSAYFTGRTLEPINFTPEPDTTDTWNHGAGHGTEVASIIIDSTGGNVQVLPLKVLPASGEGTQISLIAAFEHIFQYQCADIINICIGWQCDTADEATACDFWNDVIHTALHDYQIPVVAASGNTGTRDTCYPACIEEVWTVGSLGALVDGVPDSNILSPFSNYGMIDFVADGYNLRAVGADGEIKSVSGTSVSAPLVTALAAGYMTVSHYASCDSLYDTIRSCCTDLGDAGYDEYYGWGLPVYLPGSENPCRDSHDFVLMSESQATCTAKAKKTYACSRCGTAREEESGGPDPDAHTGYQYTITTATCTKPSYKIKTCKGCHRETARTIYAEASGHSFGEPETGEKLSDDQKYLIAYRTFVCAVCGETSTEEISRQENTEASPLEPSTGQGTEDRPDSSGGTPSTSSQWQSQPKPEKPTKPAAASTEASTKASAEAPKTTEQPTGKTPDTYPKKPKIFSLKNKSKRRLTASCPKQPACRYQFQCAGNKKFKRAATKRTGKNTVTWKGMKKGKRYYIRVRAYKTINGKVYYSPWSKAKSIQIKR